MDASELTLAFTLGREGVNLRGGAGFVVATMGDSLGCRGSLPAKRIRVVEGGIEDLF